MRIDLKITANEEPVGKDEIFRYGHFRFKPYRAWKLIHERKLRPKIELMDITTWATQILGVTKGEKKPQKLLVFGVKVIHEHAMSLTDERLEEPGILVITKYGGLVIDGNHRLARRFMEGHTDMKMYVLTESQARKHLIMT